MVVPHEIGEELQEESHDQQPDMHAVHIRIRRDDDIVVAQSFQAFFDIEEGLEGLRYNNIVIATDADVDGMHIRLLIMTFFLQFFPDLVRNNHVYILETPLFRVRNKQKTIYCYTDMERQRAIKELGTKPEI